ncbi:MAG: alpha/beta fold hydrolase [Pseudonocardiaceae bacterium]
MAEVIAGGVRFHVQRLAPHRAVRRPSPEHPIVFIHGLGLDNLSSFYYTLANPVAHAGADVILYDQRGHGLSECPQAGYRVSDSVADLVAILGALDVDVPVHLVGHSYGGAIALSFAVAYPERVASMLLIEAHVPIPGWGEQMIANIRKAERDLSEGDLGRQVVSIRKYARLAAVGQNLINRTTFMDDLLATEPIAEENLRMFTRPVRAVYGEHSDVLSHAHLLDGLLPQYTLTVLPDLDHFVLARDARVLRAIVLEWFATRTPVGCP